MTSLKPDPVAALFGVRPFVVELSDTESTVLRFVALLAQRLILLNWKQKKTLWMLVQDIMKHLKLENLNSYKKEELKNSTLPWSLPWTPRTTKM